MKYYLSVEILIKKVHFIFVSIECTHMIQKPILDIIVLLVSHMNVSKVLEVS